MLWRALCLFNDKDNLKIILGSALFLLSLVDNKSRSKDAKFD